MDACLGKALESEELSREEVVCTKTLFNHVDRGLINIKNIDLSENVSRKSTLTAALKTNISLEAAYADLNSDSWNNKNAISSSKYWREKLFLTLKTRKFTQLKNQTHENYKIITPLKNTD